MGKNIICIIQARLKSTRLPGKVLLPLANKPVIEHVFNQLSFSKILKKIVLATSTEKSDDPLEKWAKKNKKEFFRGSLNNVLERYYLAAKKFESEIIVRITADCPLIDPTIVDLTINKFIDGQYDYFSNTLNPTFPDGLDTEVFSFSTLEKAFINSKLKSELEHVTPYIKNNPQFFKIGNLSSEINYEKYRWTIDNNEDYELLKIIFDNLSREGNFVYWKDVIKFLQFNTSLSHINKHLKRNEGYEKSLKEDKLL